MVILNSSVRMFWVVTLSEAIVGRRVGPGQDESRDICVAFFLTETWQKIAAEFGIATYKFYENLKTAMAPPDVSANSDTSAMCSIRSSFPCRSM
jgi:hypothetical protein